MIFKCDGFVLINSEYHAEDYSALWERGAFSSLDLNISARVLLKYKNHLIHCVFFFSVSDMQTILAAVLLFGTAHGSIRGSGGDGSCLRLIDGVEIDCDRGLLTMLCSFARAVCHFL